MNTHTTHLSGESTCTRDASQNAARARVRPALAEAEARTEGRGVSLRLGLGEILGHRATRRASGRS